MDDERPWRDKVGGMWDGIGSLQFNYMVQNGLKPNHQFLDVGCGCLRGGTRYAKYLDWGNYCGIDKDGELMEKGKLELSEVGIPVAAVNLHCDSSFSFEVFNKMFDFMIAQSVFTHINLNDIQLCLYKASKVLKPTGKFFATFFEDDDYHIDETIRWENGIITASDSDIFHYRFDILKFIAGQFGLDAEYIGEWNHPRLQRMILFKKASGAE